MQTVQSDSSNLTGAEHILLEAEHKVVFYIVADWRLFLSEVI